MSYNTLGRKRERRERAVCEWLARLGGVFASRKLRYRNAEARGYYLFRLFPPAPGISTFPTGFPPGRGNPTCRRYHIGLKGRLPVQGRAVWSETLAATFLITGTPADMVAGSSGTAPARRCWSHALLRALPVSVPGILGQQLLLQRGDARAVPPPVEPGALLHGGEGAPALK